ncbi:MAG: 2-keto-4-pentenoate hydratase [Burkholderiales bacterium]
MRALFYSLLLLAGLAAAAHACPPQERVQALARDWTNRTPVKGLQGLSMEDALCGRTLFVAELGKDLGRVVGYKAALTNPEVQMAVKLLSPVRGVLLDRMLIRAPADGEPVTVPAQYGARPLVEADLVVEVRDARIHDAKTDLELLQSLVRVYPFIELADFVVAAGEPITGPTVVMINAGARAGVLGAPLDVQATQAFADALRDMKVLVTDGKGGDLARGTGSAVLRHPLNAVRWLADDLAQAGIRLRPGDLLSLGSFTAPLTPEAGETVRVRYEGLPGNPRLAVRFK